MGTSIAHDCLPNLVSKKNKILFVKVGIVIGIILSLILGYKLPGSFIARGTAIFFGICAASFLPTYFAAIYWKRASKEGAIASIITGIISSIFALFFLHQKEAETLGLCKFLFGKDVLITKFPWPFVDPILFSLLLAIIVLVIVSLMTKKISDKHLTMCFKKV
ncbi:MAG: hypothetical protein A2Y40_00680 [Candidatus Margulisbacteria bacterium GWF2_35_9]|nr:MAG: hypothetical protein A2Y40_00680 [Candidatus Margulisbacteria bacterium GWF2_35_9]